MRRPRAILPDLLIFVGALAFLAGVGLVVDVLLSLLLAVAVLSMLVGLGMAAFGWLASSAWR